MALNGSSIRDTARVLKVSPTSNYSPPLASSGFIRMLGELISVY
jgi:hypothetical protein